MFRTYSVKFIKKIKGSFSSKNSFVSCFAERNSKNTSLDVTRIFKQYAKRQRYLCNEKYVRKSFTLLNMQIVSEMHAIYVLLEQF